MEILNELMELVREHGDRVIFDRHGRAHVRLEGEEERVVFMVNNPIEIEEALEELKKFYNAIPEEAKTERYKQNLMDLQKVITEKLQELEDLKVEIKEYKEILDKLLVKCEERECM